MTIHFAAKSVTGRVRASNQDRVLATGRPDGSTVLAVADGLGGMGQQMGEVAAERAIQALEDFAPPAGEDMQGRLTALAKAVSDDLLKAGEQDAAYEHMGTTLIALLANGHDATWVHVGDSRLYLMRGGVLQQVTTDQNMAQFLIGEGVLRPEEAETSPFRNILEQCLGMPDCEPVTGTLRVQAADVLLLCSDGLSSEVAMPELERILNEKGGLGEKADLLVAAAMANGGRDNISVVVARAE